MTGAAHPEFMFISGKLATTKGISGFLLFDIASVASVWEFFGTPLFLSHSISALASSLSVLQTFSLSIFAFWFCARLTD
jgi:hypothetical protein